MLKLKISDTKHVFLTFVHEQYDTILKDALTGIQLRGITIAKIYANHNDGYPVGTGVAWCSVHDNFNKAKGRKVALTNALKKTDLTQWERKTLWTEYFTKGRDH